MSCGPIYFGDVIGRRWQVVRRLTSELKDTKMARNMEKATIDDRLVQELQRQLDELKESRDLSLIHI